MKKRLFSILLILCMVLVMTPTAAFAEGESGAETLQTGQTYYFDLSGEGIPGTVNIDTKSESVPDETLHYVPFKYADTIYAYSLKDASDSDTNPHDRNLFISEHNITHTVSWNELNDKDLIFGKAYTGSNVNYTLRAPSAGSSGSEENKQGIPNNNEWDTILHKETGNYLIIDCWYAASWGQETSGGKAVNRAGGGEASDGSEWKTSDASTKEKEIGYRPVLELSEGQSFKVVTLNLGSGWVGDSGEHDAEIIVKSSGSFQAPAKEGLTRPNDNDDTYFSWLGSDGNRYAPGEEVPSSVNRLIALWEEDFFYGITVTTENGDEVKVTSGNCDDVVGDGTVVLTPGNYDNTKPIDWNKVLNGENVEGFRPFKLTLNDAALKKIDVTAWYPDTYFLQLELIGENTVNYTDTGSDEYKCAIYAEALLVTGSGSLNVTAAGNDAAAIGIGSAYVQNGGTVTLNSNDEGIYCSEARFRFVSGKLTINSKTTALYCDPDAFEIARDNTTFYCGDLADKRFEIKSPFTWENISDQLEAAINAGKLDVGDEGLRMHYAQLTSNHTVTFDTDGGSAVQAQTVAYGETVEKPADPVRSGYTFKGWYLGENAYNFDAPVTKDLTVTARWSYNGGGSSYTYYTYYTIQASVNANGAITPSGTISVREGSDQTFTITPDQGYDVADVKIDGKSIGAVRSYTFEKVKGSHTIEVEIDREEVIKQAKAEELTASILLTARSVKTAKKNVKVRLEMDAESAAAIRELQALGYMVKYKFYRSEKKAWQYEAKLTKASKVYVNTQGEKGKRYYYKARVLVYDQNGRLVTYSKLTQCKYAARLWTK